MGKGIDLNEYLPDGASALMIGTKYSDDFMGMGAQSRLKRTIFDLSHLLQRLGYATLPIPRLPVEELNRMFDFDNENTHFTHLITEFPLQSTKIDVALTTQEKVPISPEAIKEFAKAKGADLTGISSVSRLNKIIPAIKSLFDREKTINIKRIYPPHTPTSILDEVSIDELSIKKPEDYLPGAKSVIVLGIHFPATTLDVVAKPPAENISSYAAATQWWGVVPEMGSLVFDLINYLNDAGYKAVTVTDLFGTSYDVNAWGPRESITSSRFAAVCAGLGEIAWNGAVLTPEYGLTQKFICLVTDAEIDEDPLYRGEALCSKCRKCVSSCPVNALEKGDDVKICIEDKIIEFAGRDRLHCEWSAKCGLVGEEGPKYLGITNNFPPPEEITAEAVYDALNQLNHVEQSWCITFEKCLSVCPTTKEVLERAQDNT